MDLVFGQQMVGYGDPIVGQDYYLTTDQIWSIIKPLWNFSSVLVSFPFRYNRSLRRTEVRMATLWFDLDVHKTHKIENALLDNAKVANLGDAWGFDVRGVLTNAGVHSHIGIEPEWIDTKDKRLTDIPRKLITLIGLRTADVDCINNLQRLARLPNSKLKEGRAIVVNRGELVGDVMVAKQQIRPYPRFRKRITLSELNERLIGVEPAKHQVSSKEAAMIEVKGVQIDPLVRLFTKRCVQVFLSLPNPPPYIRWYAAVMLKRMGFTEDEANSYFEALQFADYSPRDTSYFISKAYEYERSSSCDAIDSRGFCIGDECPWYRGRFDGNNTHGRQRRQKHGVPNRLLGTGT